MISSIYIVYGKPRSHIDNNGYHDAIYNNRLRNDDIYTCLVLLLFWVLMYSFLWNIQKFTIISIIKYYYLYHDKIYSFDNLIIFIIAQL